MHIFLFITVIISLVTTTLALYLLCKHKNLQTPIASLVLHQVKEVGTVMQKEINSEYKTLTYISLFFSILGLVMFAILHYRKSKLCRRQIFSNAVKIMIFIADVYQSTINSPACRCWIVKHSTPATTNHIKPYKGHA